jgi:hypothetical protein
LGILLFIFSAFISCKGKKPNYVNSQAIGALKQLSLAHFSYGDQVTYVDATEGDAQLNKGMAALLGKIDSEAVFARIAKGPVFGNIKVLDGVYTSNSSYSAALAAPLSAKPSTLADIAKHAKVDGLLWIGREYRVRSVRGFMGDRHTKWNGEVSSHMYLFDADGRAILQVNWITESDTKREGSTLTSEETLLLLSDAVEHTAENTADILIQAASGKGIPEGLKEEERSETAQERAHSASELGIAARGILIVLLIIFAVTSLKGTSRFGKIIGLALLGIILFLLIGRGWWKDTILAILDFIKEAIFG